ncbi:MAG: ATP-binding protein [Parachlamydiaceae bacterium]
MKRDIERELLAWKTSPIKAPLLLRGARQVGKSWVVEKFGRDHYENLVVINFEQRPEAKACFTTLLPEKIISAIELLTNSIIHAGKTLLFLDEIQECPQAIVALRYFKEQMPALHIIGAGSLLEFVLNTEDFSMPVGRVQFLYMRPLSFYEFLSAMGRENLRSHLEMVTVSTPPQEVIHEELLKLVREYVALGGMPAVIDAYLQTKSLYQTQDVQSDILATYRRDFGKYSKKAGHKYLNLLFEKAPGLIAKWFKYSKVDPDVNPREIKVALQQLCQAGLLYQVHHTSASGLPLITTQNEKKFKLLFLDVGLVKRACFLEMSLLFQEDLMLINQGLLSEQFVGQELLAHSDKKDEGHLFFWIREQKSSSAEVDFIVPVGSQVIPIEVKSGTVGKMKSLRIFMEEKKSSIGVRISNAPLALEDRVLSIPFYLIGELSRLVQTNSTATVS